MCSICLEDFVVDDNILLSCKHQYHKSCIDSWLLKSDLCPLCRCSVDGGIKDLLVDMSNEFAFENSQQLIDMYKKALNCLWHGYQKLFDIRMYAVMALENQRRYDRKHVKEVKSEMGAILQLQEQVFALMNAESMEYHVLKELFECYGVYV